jgi:antitoxin MazE
MKTRIQKWGNSLAVRVPKPFADGLGLKEDSPVEMALETGAIIVRPDLDRTFDLDALLAKVSDENIHPEWETEPANSGGDPEEGEP